MTGENVGPGRAKTPQPKGPKSVTASSTFENLLTLNLKWTWTWTSSTQNPGGPLMSTCYTQFGRQLWNVGFLNHVLFYTHMDMDPSLHAILKDFTIWISIRWLQTAVARQCCYRFLSAKLKRGILWCRLRKWCLLDAQLTWRVRKLDFVKKFPIQEAFFLIRKQQFTAMFLSKQYFS